MLKSFQSQHKNANIALYSRHECSIRPIPPMSSVYPEEYTEKKPLTEVTVCPRKTEILLSV